MCDGKGKTVTWQETVQRDRDREGDELVDQAIENSRQRCMSITAEDAAWLESNGYCPWAARRGVGGGTSIWLSKYGPSGPIYTRDRVCYVDGHEGSDIDPGAICIHCGLYEGDTCDCGSPNCWLCDDEGEQ